MIICPNCNHQNPEGSVQCENCYTPLPSTYPCPNCGAFVQADATFCGQCGFNLQGRDNRTPQAIDNVGEDKSQDFSLDEDLAPTAVNVDSFKSPWDLEEEEAENLLEINEPSFNEAEITQPPASPFEEMKEEELFLEEEDSVEDEGETEDLELWISSVKEESLEDEETDNEEINELFALDDLDSDTQFPSIEGEIEELSEPPTLTPSLAEPETIAENELETASLELDNQDFAAIPDIEVTNLETDEPEFAPVSNVEATSLETHEPELVSTSDAMSEVSVNIDSSTRLQIQQAILFHTQTGNTLEIPPDLAVVRIGKFNNQVPPDIDVSGFPNSEIVSRVHADIRVEGDTYFIEDRGSSNGTYINNSPLLTGNRHRLRAGDRISLGKGDLVTFLFQLG